MDKDDRLKEFFRWIYPLATFLPWIIWLSTKHNPSSWLATTLGSSRISETSLCDLALYQLFISYIILLIERAILAKWFRALISFFKAKIAHFVEWRRSSFPLAKFTITFYDTRGNEFTELPVRIEKTETIEIDFKVELNTKFCTLWQKASGKNIEVGLFWSQGSLKVEQEFWLSPGCDDQEREEQLQKAVISKDWQDAVISNEKSRIYWSFLNDMDYSNCQQQTRGKITEHTCIKIRPKKTRSQYLRPYIKCYGFIGTILLWLFVKKFDKSLYLSFK